MEQRKYEREKKRKEKQINSLALETGRQIDFAFKIPPCTILFCTSHINKTAKKNWLGLYICMQKYIGVTNISCTYIIAPASLFSFPLALVLSFPHPYRMLHLMRDFIALDIASIPCYIRVDFQWWSFNIKWASFRLMLHPVHWTSALSKLTGAQGSLVFFGAVRMCPGPLTGHTIVLSDKYTQHSCWYIYSGVVFDKPLLGCLLMAACF